MSIFCVSVTRQVMGCIGGSLITTLSRPSTVSCVNQVGDNHLHVFKYLGVVAELMDSAGDGETEEGQLHHDEGVGATPTGAEEAGGGGAGGAGGVGGDWWLASAATFVLATVSSFILLLFIVTLVLHFLPRLQRWLLPLLAKIAAVERHRSSSSSSNSSRKCQQQPQQLEQAEQAEQVEQVEQVEQHSPASHSIALRQDYQQSALHLQPFHYSQR